MQNYSFIMEFRGGTYIAQHYAVSLNSAIQIWANELPVEAIPYLSLKTKNRLIIDLPQLINDNEFIAIESVKNVWLGGYRFKTGFARIHVIKTDVM